MPPSTDLLQGTLDLIGPQQAHTMREQSERAFPHLVHYFHTVLFSRSRTFVSVTGYYSFQRRRNLPEEESGPRTFERTGNGTHARQLERWK
jgi:hypothetical protein